MHYREWSLSAYTMVISILENGDFLALDLGGTNFRVLLCQMRNGQCESISKNYNVPKAKLYGPAVGVSSLTLTYYIMNCP